MSAKRIVISLCVLVAVLAASSRHATAQTVDACLWATRSSDCQVFPPAAMGVGLCAGTPSNTVFGHLPQAGVVGEVAVVQTVIAVGDEVPLPTYADGSPAQESEVFWTAQLWFAEFPYACGVVRWGGDHAVASFQGRRFVAGTAQINPSGPVSPPTTNFQVVVNVVAIRSGTTPARSETFGSIKTRYR